MSFYDDASLIFLAGAAAGKDGKAYSVKPVPEYGPELVTNGDFATDSDWNKEASWSISGGTANYSGVSNAIITQTNLLPQSTSATLKVQWTQTITSGTRLRFFARNYNDSSSSGITVVSVETTGDATYQSGNCNFSGTFTAIVTTTDGFSFKMLGEAGNVGSIDNVSVREVLSPAADFTFSRGSNLSATRVGPTGLIEKGRENLLTQSNDFTTWGLDDVTITSGQGGYDGTNNATKVLGNTNSSRHNLIRSFSLTAPLAISIYVKASGHNYIQIASATTSGQYINFDLSDGSIGNAGGDVISEYVEDIGGGWYRIGFVTGRSLNSYYISLVSSKTAGWLESWAMPNATDGVLIQSAQIEQGLAVTPYIESFATTGKAGLLEDEPRFDYSGGVTCPSLLKEKQRTNIVTNSEYWNDWQEVRASISFNEATSPEGLTNASLLVDSVDSNTHISQSIYHTSSGTAPVTWSLFAKKQNNRYISLRLLDDAANSSGNTNYIVANYDLENGVVTDTLESGSPTNASADIEDYGNGWYRLIISMTKKSGITRTDTQIRLAKDGVAKAGEAFTGTGNDGNYIYGLQLEKGDYPTSYIPNHSGGTITRSDELTNYITVGGGSEKWSLMYEFDFNKTPLQQNEIFSNIRNATSDVAITFRHFTRDSVKRVISPYFNLESAYPFGSAGASSVTDSSVLLRANGDGSYDYFASLNGVVTKASVTGMSNIAFSRIDLGAGASTAHKKVILFANTLSDADCTALIGTSYDTFADMAEALNYTVYE